MASCVGIVGRIFGHKYEARISTTERHRDINLKADRAMAEDFRRMMTLFNRTYHGDVCTRCGGIVKRPSTPE